MTKVTQEKTIGQVWATCKRFLKRRWRWILVALVVLLLIGIPAVLVWTGRLEKGFDEYIPPEPGAERAKTLWDLMELVFVPLVLAGGALLFTSVTNRRERERELDRAREAALQTYLDRMTELIEKRLVESEASDPKRSVARVRTLTVLRQLDGERKGLLLRFLHESELIDKKEAIVELSQADLTGADLSKADLPHANLRGAVLSEGVLSRAKLREANLSKTDLTKADLLAADLTDADLTEADLSGADLRGAVLSKAHLQGAKLREAKLLRTDLTEADLFGADLRGADLNSADLSGANLRHVDLSGAEVTDQQLAVAKSLKDATIPDGKKHE